MLQSIYKNLLLGLDQSKAHAGQAVDSGLPVYIDYSEEGVLAKFYKESGKLTADVKYLSDKRVKKLTSDKYEKFLSDIWLQGTIISKKRYEQD